MLLDGGFFARRHVFLSTHLKYFSLLKSCVEFCWWSGKNVVYLR